MWILILVAVHIFDPSDRPGKIEIMFPDQQSCEQAVKSIKWDLKFKNFKVTAECKKQS